MPPGSPGRDQTRDRAIRTWLPLAYGLARTYGGRQALDDLRQVAAVALIHAVDRFQPWRGTDFPSYASQVIRGELRHHLRDTGWSVRPPRPLRELAQRSERAAGYLSQRLGRWPTTADLATALRVDADQLAAARQAVGARLSVSLDARPPDGPPTSDRLGAEDRRFDDVLDRLALRDALTALTGRQRRVLAAAFFDGRTQHQIAAELGTSQPNVCRLRAQALARLYERMRQP